MALTPSLFPESAVDAQNRFHNWCQLLIAATLLQYPFFAQKKVGKQKKPVRI
jgi:hypothetical protein